MDDIGDTARARNAGEGEGASDLIVFLALVYRVVERALSHAPEVNAELRESILSEVIQVAALVTFPNDVVQIRREWGENP